MDGVSFERAAEQLKVYDVDQGAWELEGEGFERNAQHVLYHLIKAATTKDFTDRNVVRADIAPDAVQYALRLGRWNGQEPRDLLRHRNVYRSTRKLPAEILHEGSPFAKTHKFHYMGAMATLAAHFHDLDHESKADAELRDRPLVVKRTASQLLVCADMQAFYFGFDLAEAFEDRLDVLREGYGIPQPPVTEA